MPEEEVRLPCYKKSHFSQFALLFGPLMYLLILFLPLGGKASWRLPAYGFMCALCCGLVSWLFWGTVRAYDLTFWLHFTQF